MMRRDFQNVHCHDAAVYHINDTIPIKANRSRGVAAFLMAALMTRGRVEGASRCGLGSARGALVPGGGERGKSASFHGPRPAGFAGAALVPLLLPLSTAFTSRVSIGRRPGRRAEAVSPRMGAGLFRNRSGRAHDLSAPPSRV